MKKIELTTNLFGLDLFSREKSTLLKILSEKLLGRSGLVLAATPNPEQVIQSTQNRSFLKTLQQFDLLLPDGIGLVWASWLLQFNNAESTKGARLKERITGTDSALWLLGFAKEHNQRVLVLGGREYGDPSQPSSTPQELSALYPKNNLSECWWLEGFRDVASPTVTEQRAVAQAVTTLKPAIVFVAFGAPHQEFWVIKQRQLLESAGVRVVLVVGGAFDYILGKVARAPYFLQVLGLEWLYRLVLQPWRWRRQLRLLQFSWLVLLKKLGR